MFDVIVLGARCAGSPAAMLLARKGYKVLLVDRSAFPSDVISTHFLWPNGASYLNRWGLLDRVLRVTPSNETLTIVQDGISLEGKVPSKLLSRYFLQWHGDDSGIQERYCSVRRHVLDAILVDAAAEAGADVRQEVAVDGLISEGGKVVGIRGRTRGGTRIEERARIVVGADGRNSFLARTLGLPKYDVRSKCTFAYWSYFSGVSPRQAHLYRRGRLGGAIVPTNDDQSMTLVWGPSEWGEHFRRDIAGHFQRALDFLDPELGEAIRSQGRREERFYGTLDQAAYLRPLSGSGWVLAGDAACFKDQCTATGMTHAFRDAELVSASLDDGMSGRSSLESAMNHYASRRRSQSAAAYYDYVCTLAEMKPLRHDELQLFAALRSNQEEANRFIATHADIAPVSEFFQASNLFLLNDAAKESSDRHAIFHDFEATSRRYRQNLFAEVGT